VGSQKFQFNRLLEEMDRVMIEQSLDKTSVFGQIGESTYNPQNFNYTKFLDKKDFDNNLEQCNLLITHGGTGSIINGLKKNKKIIAVPRDKKFAEHIDNHQYEIIEQFAEAKLIYPLYNIENIGEVIKNIGEHEFNLYESNTERFVKELESQVQLFHEKYKLL
jgi:UDP-N-acetylglucosamine transferase subunit ALG13